MKDKTSSSYSGVHFRHYKALGQSEYLSSLLAWKIMLIAQSECLSEHWGVGLTVMLEKVAWEALVSKL